MSWASPGFPVELVGVGELHAAFLTESRTREHDWSRVQEIRVTRAFSAHVRRGELGAPVQFLFGPENREFIMKGALP